MTFGQIVSALLGTVAIGATSFGAAQLLESPEARSPASVTLGTTGTVETTGTTATTVETTGTTTTVDATTTAGGREPGEDVRGPCDEAEHRNDPRCTGAAADDDRSGPGRGGDEEDRDDRSGSNSGPG